MSACYALVPCQSFVYLFKLIDSIFDIIFYWMLIQKRKGSILSHVALVSFSIFLMDHFIVVHVTTLYEVSSELVPYIIINNFDCYIL